MKKKFKELPETIISPISGDTLKKEELEGDEIGTEDEMVFPLNVYRNYDENDSPSWYDGDVACYSNEDSKERLYIPYEN